MVYVIGVIIWGIVWGVATNAVIHNKGYDENWFWWGFFFGFIAFIVALTKSENRKSYSYSDDSSSYTSNLGSIGSIYSQEAQNKRTLSEGGWTCKCGRINTSYIGTCACGRTKADVQREEAEAKELAQKRQNEADELNRLSAIKELKELLDAGAITQEEFDNKKKSLLGL